MITDLAAAFLNTIKKKKTAIISSFFLTEMVFAFIENRNGGVGFDFVYDYR